MNAYFDVHLSTLKETPAANVPMRCPHCRRNGIFHGAREMSDVRFERSQTSNIYRAGIRICPNSDCRGIIFVVTEDGELVFSSPPETIDFDATNLPPKILSTLEEAILAHSIGAYRASALMVRRTLEELCEIQSATGGNLKTRLESLGKVVVIPAELLDAADELRLLGNDAAHVEAKAYDQIGNDEAALAIELTKELLKAVYQYTSLVTRMRALKKAAP